MQRCIDIVCGTGNALCDVAKAFPNAKLTDSEVFGVVLSFAALQEPQLELLNKDALHIQYVDWVDAIGTFNLLEHIK